MAVARRLRRLAEEVERMGRPGASLDTGLPDHFTPALNVTNRVHSELARLGLVDLLLAAVRADHPTARFTPAQLLDKATSAVVVHLDGPREDGWTEAVAEAALRGAEVLR
jgi:hypothetical protein